MVVPAKQESDRTLLLGEDEARYGEFRLEVLPSARVACSLSVGADPSSPALMHKGQRALPNEDGLLAIEEGPRVLLAVADAHHGHLSSHLLLRRLAEALERVPANPAALMRALHEVERGEMEPDIESETTLLVAVLRRDLGAGFGFSFGDSTCTAVGGTQRGEAFNRHNRNYVSPTEPGSLAADRAAFFEFDIQPGSLLLAFTDGIDGCHYRRPQTSLGPAQYRALFEQTGPDAEAYARGLTSAALEGLEGSPGGQDNIALIVAAG